MFSLKNPSGLPFGWNNTESFCSTAGSLGPCNNIFAFTWVADPAGDGFDKRLEQWVAGARDFWCAIKLKLMVNWD